MSYTLQQIREMREKITSGKWEWYNSDPNWLVSYDDRNSLKMLNVEAVEALDEDRAFIAASPAIVDQLLEKIEELDAYSLFKEIKGSVEGTINEREELKRKIEKIYAWLRVSWGGESEKLFISRDDVLALFGE